MTFRLPASILLCVTLTVALTGCSSVESIFSSDRLDYRGAATKTPTLEVPPDLTQLARDGRYTPQASGAVSASAFGNPAATAVTAASTTSVAPTSLGDFKLMREGNLRWLATSLPADKIWSQLRTFWTDLGFTLAVDSAETGTIETSWAENRAKLPEDALRRTLGRLIDSFYSTGERDKFRMRVERAANGNGSEIYVTHFGMVEELVGPLKETTTWTTRPNDPLLEAELLQRVMVKLGTKPDDAKAVVAGATPTAGTPGTAAAVRARAVTGQPTPTVQVDDNFDRAWRRVGIALDRNGFTVEDRDRSTGTYYVRYADPRFAGQDEPGFFARLFSGTQGNTGPARYRVQVKGEGERSTVSILNGQGAPEPGDIGQRIATLLVDELR